MRRDFVPAVGKKLFNRFFFLTRIAGVRHRVAKIKLIRAPRLHQLPRHNFAFRNFFLKLFDCEAVEIRVRVRSEEHTSELQSQSNLVCRLLLEKKKNKTDRPTTTSSTSRS